MLSPLRCTHDFARRTSRRTSPPHFNSAPGVGSRTIDSSSPAVVCMDESSIVRSCVQHEGMDVLESAPHAGLLTHPCYHHAGHHHHTTSKTTHAPLYHRTCCFNTATSVGYRTIDSSSAAVHARIYHWALTNSYYLLSLRVSCFTPVVALNQLSTLAPLRCTQDVNATNSAPTHFGTSGGLRTTTQFSLECCFLKPPTSAPPSLRTSPGTPQSNFDT